MGLLQDARGVPIVYRKFPGNTPDSQTMLPVPADMKRDHGPERVVAVAALKSAAENGLLVQVLEEAPLSLSEPIAPRGKGRDRGRP